MEMSTIATIAPLRAWGIDIPNYFWFTGSSAAAFIISSFAHVFGWKQFKPIAGFSLLLAFVLLAVAPLNLIDDLQQPGRLINFFLYGWENFGTSPMKWGVLLLIAYPLLILIEALVLYRPYFVKRIPNTNVFYKKFYTWLAFGRVGLDEESLEKDHKWGFILGAIGIPLALSVHGYTGYILGAVHANTLWHTPLMPVLFLASAMVSGSGLLIVLLPIFQRFFSISQKVDKNMVAILAKLLAWFIVIDLVVRALWLSFAMPFGTESRFLLYEFFTLHFDTVVYVEYGLCLIVPMIVGFSKLRNIFWVVFSMGIISAVGVWLFRWNTVIGGQEIPSSMPGFTTYLPEFFGQNSIASVASNWAAFIALLAIVAAIFPWDEEMEDNYQGVENAA
ncbi:MAG: polysulfide reductase NrfD [Campylobacteraceae bacterium]|nr:polysulfide reductase NrfD [Campylobacteraceae bacterium]